MRLFKSKNIVKYSDNELIDEYKTKQDAQLIGELYKRYSHLVFGVCMKYLKNESEAEDSAIQIFENLLEDLLKHDIKNFKSWLHSVTRNHCLMFLRKQQTVLKREKEYEHTLTDFTEPESNFEPHEKETQEKMLTSLEKAIEYLKEEQKICIQLFFLQEKRYEEVAEITGFSIKQVKSYIQNGKRNLANYMKSEH